MTRKKGPTYEDGDEPLRCRAKRTRDGQRCGNRKVKGREVCRKHGGTNPGRPVKHGRYSKRIPRLLADGYAEAIQDAEAMIDLSETLAVQHAIVARRMERVDEKDSPEFRKQAVGLFEQMRTASSAEDGIAATKALGEHLRQGTSEEYALTCLANAVRELALRQEEVWRLRFKSEHAITVKDLVGLIARVVDLARQILPDDLALQFVDRLDREVVGNASRRLSP